MTLTTLRTDFSGGLNSSVVDSGKLESNEYVFLSNGRSRGGNITPIKGAVALTLPKVGLVQGIYGAGDYLLIFISGEAFYKRATDANFTQIKDLRLSETVERIWVEAVPASSVNRSRLLISSDNEAAGVKFSDLIQGNPAGVVASDGINRPWVIFASGYARVIQTYAEWSLTGDREYIPTGITNLVWTNGRLYGLLNNAVVASVTGRPLDFVVSIDIAGDKALSEEEGGAKITSHTADFGTAISLSKTNVGGLLLATSKTVYLLTPDFENTLFGEHTFTQEVVSDVGVSSPLSGVSLGDDFAYVDVQGPKKLREVSYAKDAPSEVGFASKISDLFEGVVQTNTAAVGFSTYAFFLVDSIFGRVIVVWDILNKSWVSVDSYAGVNNPKFLAVARSDGASKLYIASDSSLWECFAATTYETVKFYPVDQVHLMLEDGSVGHDLKPKLLHFFFSAAFGSGNISVIPYSSQKGGVPVTLAVASTAQQITSMPFARSFSSQTPRYVVPLPNSISGWKVGVELQWAFNAELAYVALESDVVKRQVSLAQQISA